MYINSLINYITLIRDESRLLVCIDIETSETINNKIKSEKIFADIESLDSLCEFMDCMGIEELNEINNSPITVECSGDIEEGVLNPNYICTFLTQERLFKLRPGFVCIPESVLVLTSEKEVSNEKD